MTGRARCELPNTTPLRVLVAVGSVIAVAAAVTVWYFADGRPIFGVAWLVLAVGWAFVAILAPRLWGSGLR